jgi:hypothetical protein
VKAVKRVVKAKPSKTAAVKAVKVVNGILV